MVSNIALNVLITTRSHSEVVANLADGVIQLLAICSPNCAHFLQTKQLTQ